MKVASIKLFTTILVLCLFDVASLFGNENKNKVYSLQESKGRLNTPNSC
jgi:hypothetical protein